MASWKNEEEMREWVRRARRGDPAAREELILGNLGLVRSVVKKLASSLSHDEEDLIQYGIIGLIRAVDGFDPDRGTKFSTYAVPFIGGAIL